MKLPHTSLEAKHLPVMLNQVLEICNSKNGGIFMDCTFGAGGYSNELLKLQQTKIIALDRDKESKKKAEKISENFKERFIFKNKKFSQLDNLKLKNHNVRGVIFDLGYSYTQIKDPEKGLSFSFSGDLNMQMGINDFSAKDVINNLGAIELEKIFKFFGEEKEAKKIANQIIIERKKKEIDTPTLVGLIEKTKRKKKF